MIESLKEVCEALLKDGECTFFEYELELLEPVSNLLIALNYPFKRDENTIILLDNNQ